MGHGCVADEVDWVRPADDARQGTLSGFPGSMCAAGTWELTFHSAQAGCFEVTTHPREACRAAGGTSMPNGPLNTDHELLCHIISVPQSFHTSCHSAPPPQTHLTPSHGPVPENPPQRLALLVLHHWELPHSL